MYSGGCQLQQRYILSVLIFTGLITNYMLRINMSIAIVKMGEGSNDTSRSPCANNDTTEDNSDDAQDNLGWSGTEVSWVLTSFFIGYTLFQVLGGRLAEMFGTRLIFGISNTGVALLALITPVLAKQSVWIIFIIRLLQGSLEAFAFPSVNHMISQWVPETEKSAFNSFAISGGTFGSIITNPMCGQFIASLGWEAVFYITGGIGLVWCIVWVLLARDSPEVSSFISEEEKKYIIANRRFDDSKDRKDNVPMIPLLIDMLKSPPMLALMMCDFANSWGLYVLVSLGPTFFWEVLNFDIGAVGFLSSLPYLGRFLGAQIIGQISSFVSRRELVKPITLQKINCVFSMVLPAAGMIWMSQLTSSPYLCTAIMSVAYACNGAIYSGHSINTITIAPNRSGTVMGLSNGFGSIAGIFIPLVKDWIVGAPATCQEMIRRWQIMFYIPSGIYIVAALNFVIFASGQVQSFDSKSYKQKCSFLW